jgi:hypothetical protein
MPVDDIAADSLTESVTPSRTIILVVAERDRRDGRYSAWHDGRLVVDGAKAPFLDAARVLLAQGLDPIARYIMRRSPEGLDALVSTLGQAAKLSVREDDHVGPIFRPWKPYGGPV